MLWIGSSTSSNTFGNIGIIFCQCPQMIGHSGTSNRSGRPPKFMRSWNLLLSRWSRSMVRPLHHGRESLCRNSSRESQTLIARLYSYGYIRPPDRDTFILQSGLLHIHCLARTEQIMTFAMSSATAAALWFHSRSKRTFSTIWNTIALDDALSNGLERQLLMRLRDVMILDYHLRYILATAMCFFTFGRSEIDEDRRHQLLYYSLRAVEHQVCIGTTKMDDQDIGSLACRLVEYVFHFLSVSLDLLVCALHVH